VTQTATRTPTHTPDPVSAAGQPHPGRDAYLASHAEGWIDGVAPWLTLATIEGDLACARRLECPRCQWRPMNAVPQHRIHPVYGGQYRVFVWCQWAECDGTEVL